MDILSEIGEIPPGPYYDLAALHLSPEKVSELIGAKFIEMADDFDVCEQAYFSSGKEGLIITAYKGVDMMCTLATNNSRLNTDEDIRNYLTALGIDPEAFRYDAILEVNLIG